MQRFTVLEVYSGPGGLSKGIMGSRFRDCRFEVIVATDHDQSASETYTANHPHVDFVLGDITKEMTKEKILKAIKKNTGSHKVDVVIGGPPCRGFSKANTVTRTKSNPLNSLPMHFIDMVKQTKPFAFIMENVPGMLSMDGGKFAENIIEIFKEMEYRNTSCWILNAAAYGVPQFRKRAFIVGSKNNSVPLRRPKETHGKNGTKPYVKLSDALNDLPYIPPGKSTSLQHNYKIPPENKFQSKMRNNLRVVKNHYVTVSNELTVKRFKAVPPGGNWKDIPKHLIQVDGKYKNLKNTHGMIYRRLLSSEPAVTITNFRKAMLIHPRQNRLLSVREAARIQTFPDNYEFKGSLNSMQQQVSDAVPLKLSTAVGTSLLQHMQKSLQKISSSHSNDYL